MDTYLLILKEKANKINADIKDCQNDKDCIKDVLAAKVKSNLQAEDLSVIKEIEQRVKEVLEEENELITSIDSQENFKHLHLDGNGHNFLDMG